MNTKLKQSFFSVSFIVFVFCCYGRWKETHSGRNIFTESSKLFENQHVFFVCPCLMIRSMFSTLALALGTSDVTWTMCYYAPEHSDVTRSQGDEQQIKCVTRNACFLSGWVSRGRQDVSVARSLWTRVRVLDASGADWDEGERIAYGRVTGASCWAAEGKKEVYMVLILFFSCFSLSSNTLYEQRKQSISNATTAAAVLHQCLPGICSDSLTAQK